MKLGILGLPGAGKSTVFDLLTESFEGADFSQAPNKPRLKVVKVDDSRLERLNDDYEPRKCTPASLEVVDFPAVAREADRSGLADILAPAREMDACVVVVRMFEAPGLPSPNAQRDLDDIRAELLLTDLALIEKRLARLEEKQRKPSFTPEDSHEQALLARLEEQLEAERPLATLELSVEERRRTSGFGFLSAKPQVVVLNVEEPGVPVDVQELDAPCGVFVTSARNELEILQLKPEERNDFLSEYGIKELSRETLITASFRAAERISFFTVGPKEVRAWTISKGETAVEAAGAVHTDMARGFIRAEVVSFDDYVRYGGVRGAREKGHLRVEGKDYIVADGDVVLFRFSV